MSKDRYEVRNCVCDYAVYKGDEIIEELILDSRRNAEIICKVLNSDSKHEKLKSEDIPEDIKEEILKEYAEDLYEEFNQVARCEGNITMKDVVDVLQLNESEVEQ